VEKGESVSVGAGKREGWGKFRNNGPYLELGKKGERPLPSAANERGRQIETPPCPKKNQKKKTATTHNVGKNYRGTKHLSWGGRCTVLKIKIGKANLNWVCVGFLQKKASRKEGGTRKFVGGGARDTLSKGGCGTYRKKKREEVTGVVNTFWVKEIRDQGGEKVVQ